MRTFFIVICLLLTGFLLNGSRGANTTTIKKTPLSHEFKNFGNWHSLTEMPLQDNIIRTLKLDDYLFRTFTNGSDQVTLYIGYYYKNKKVGAAHDPLVCYPGQGWTLKQRRTNTTTVTAGNHKKQIHYATMIAARNGYKDFLLYWFQASDTATSDTFHQKIALLKSTLLSKGEESAFVRISIPMSGRNSAECKKILLSFVNDFYPAFNRYVNSTVNTEK